LNTSSKAGLVLLVVLLAGVGLLVWKVTVGGHGSEGLTKLTKADMETIFKDAPPQALKRLAEDPELKKKQIEEIKQFLAVAEEARASGFANKEEIKKDLEEIRMTVTAVSYDKEKNKDKENLPPFSAITKEMVDGYMQKDGNLEKFDKLIKEQIEKAKKDGRIPETFEPQPEQIEQAKEQYAKVRISSEQAKTDMANMSEEFKRTTELQVKLQQAQYLEQMYSKDVIAPKVKATDAEIDKYLAEHPEEAKVLTEKKAKAEEILKRAMAGEDFAKLAQETTEDPGSKKDGGLYKDVTKGAMVKEFEEGALALQPGQVADKLIESKYGYHIIKLERKGVKKVADETKATSNSAAPENANNEGKEEETYDARHILISTMGASDPTNPMAQPQPLKEKIRADIEKEKEKKILDEIVAKHPIVIEDFEIKVPEMPQGQEGMPPGMQGPNGQPQMDEKQMEELQKRIKELQEQQKNAPKGKDAPKPASNTGK
jgi:parvulin-like peptidyl-prolyl isomerase